MQVRKWGKGKMNERADPEILIPAVSLAPQNWQGKRPWCNPATITVVDVPNMLRIRQFQKADFDRLWLIDQACFDPQLAYSRPELAFYMRRPGSFTLVADTPVAEAENVAANGNGNNNDNVAAPILGFIVSETRRKTGHIITIDVVAEARRSGVGSALLQAAEEQLWRAGAITAALETPVNNEAAIRFYKQKGYFVEKTIAGYYSGQLDALVMTKELAVSRAR
jgi:ribosomal protein S18 acetylase RimI-like enzyme